MISLITIAINHQESTHFTTNLLPFYYNAKKKKTFVQFRVRFWSSDTTLRAID